MGDNRGLGGIWGLAENKHTSPCCGKKRCKYGECARRVESTVGAEVSILQCDHCTGIHGHNVHATRVGIIRTHHRLVATDKSR